MIHFKLLFWVKYYKEIKFILLYRLLLYYLLYYTRPYINKKYIDTKFSHKKFNNRIRINYLHNIYGYIEIIFAEVPWFFINIPLMKY